MGRHRVCSVAGCPTIHDGTTSRCPTHEQAAKQAHWTRTKGYNTKGHRITFRLAVLRRDPICVLCGVRESTDADHHPRERQTLIDLGLNPNDPAHGRGLCSQCHKTETAANQPGGWNAR